MKVAKQTDEYNGIIKNLKETFEKLKKATPTLTLEETKIHDDLVKKTEEFYIAISHNTAASLHAAKFHDWMRIPKYTITDSFGKDFKKRFEAYVQGYIMYFEENDRVTAREDRTLYFDWNPGPEHDLIIYMKPLYLKNYGGYNEKATDFPFPFPPPPTTVDPPKLPKVPPPYPS